MNSNAIFIHSMGEYNFYFSPEYDWYGQVIHYKSNRAFYIKMTKADSDWNPLLLVLTLRWSMNQFKSNFDIKDGQHVIRITEDHLFAGQCC